MKATYNKIIVSVDAAQKECIVVNGAKFLLAKQYNNNRREQHPVVCRVVVGNNKIENGKWLIVHHNRFAEHSANEIGEGLYSIPYNSGIFALINEDGSLKSLCGNIICERIEKKEQIDIPAHLRKNYNDRVIVKSDGYGFKNGQEVFTYMYSDYEIVYVWNGEEKRAVKVFKDDIVAILVK